MPTGQDRRDADRFKYIGEKIETYEKTGTGSFLFGYEESYGYLAGTFARIRMPSAPHSYSAKRRPITRRRG